MQKKKLKKRKQKPSRMKFFFYEPKIAFIQIK